jgi:hypothetical protein
MTQWEYRCERLGARGFPGPEGLLNDLGAEGWELVSTHAEEDVGGKPVAFHVFLKRPLPSGPIEL